MVSVHHGSLLIRKSMSMSMKYTYSVHCTTVQYSTIQWYTTLFCNMFIVHIILFFMNKWYSKALHKSESQHIRRINAFFFKSIGSLKNSHNSEIEKYRKSVHALKSNMKLGTKISSKQFFTTETKATINSCTLYRKKYK